MLHLVLFTRSRVPFRQIHSERWLLAGRVNTPLLVNGLFVPYIVFAVAYILDLNFNYMKIRTTLNDLNSLNFTPCNLPCVHSKGTFFHRLPDDEMSHYARELPDNSYNSLSLNDASLFSKLQGMDKLHKADAVASMYKRSLNIKNQTTKNDFLIHYK